MTSRTMFSGFLERLTWRRYLHPARRRTNTGLQPSFTSCKGRGLSAREASVRTRAWAGKSRHARSSLRLFLRHDRFQYRTRAAVDGLAQGPEVHSTRALGACVVQLLPHG